MLSNMKVSGFQVLCFLLFLYVSNGEAWARYKFVVEEVPYTRLCNTTKILTVNGQLPGPTLYVHRGETIIVDVYNKGNHNITLHWHGVAQPRNPWSDGPEYITQCPIQPGKKFSQKIIFSTEEGTLWWHAHSDLWRATVYGAVVIYPKIGDTYPFPKPAAEFPILLGEWWKESITDEYNIVDSGSDPNASDAYTINGQPGDLYNCSKSGTFNIAVHKGLTYLLRIINAALQDVLFFSIADHNLTVVASDASYLKPFSSSFIAISPGQTIDVLLEANQSPNHYYMAARIYTGVTAAGNPDYTTTTAIIKYSGKYTPSSSPILPSLPYYNDSTSFLNFTNSFRSLADAKYPIDVPTVVDVSLDYLFSVTLEFSRIVASVNNVSFVNPPIDILQAYYYGINGVYDTSFPDTTLQILRHKTKVKVLDYNSTVEIVLRTTDAAGSSHPMHLHGYSFYVVGSGTGTFDNETDPSTYNLIDPPFQNTIAVPVQGWTTIRFKANNPGVWFMHCHFDRHMVWGMDTVFIVKNGNSTNGKLSPPPPDMPPC
ncbi:hypothetical protein SLE2022_238680 [Rubroshorea leprosula]